MFSLVQAWAQPQTGARVLMGLGVVSPWSVHGLCPFSILLLWALPLLAPHSYLGCVTCISPPHGQEQPRAEPDSTLEASPFLTHRWP